MKDGVSKVTQIRKERSLEELVNTRVGEVPLAPSLNDRIQEPEVHHHQIARLQKGFCCCARTSAIRLSRNPSPPFGSAASTSAKDRPASRTDSTLRRAAPSAWSRSRTR